MEQSGRVAEEPARQGPVQVAQGPSARLIEAPRHPHSQEVAELSSSEGRGRAFPSVLCPLPTPPRLQLTDRRYRGECGKWTHPSPGWVGSFVRS